MHERTKRPTNRTWAKSRASCKLRPLHNPHHLSGIVSALN
jgi:hypothetical protein